MARHQQRKRRLVAQGGNANTVQPTAQRTAVVLADDVGIHFFGGAAFQIIHQARFPALMGINGRINIQ